MGLVTRKEIQANLGKVTEPIDERLASTLTHKGVS
jgi:hypothetical protein